MITPRDIDVTRTLAEFYVLNRPQIQRLCFPEDPSGRITRRRLQGLVSAGFINRHQLFTFDPLRNAPAPVDYPSRQGIDFLVGHFDNLAFQNACCQPPPAGTLLHWLAVSDTHIVLREAVAIQSDVQMLGWINEWDMIDAKATTPEKRYRLYTLLNREPRRICAPDAAFLLQLRGFRKVFYVEQDRETSGIHRIAATKTPGYATMAEQQLHRRHFAETNVDAFTVLCITTGERRRDALRKAFRGKPGAEFWRFVSQTDVTADKLLTAPICYPCEGEPSAIVIPEKQIVTASDPANAKSESSMKDSQNDVSQTTSDKQNNQQNTNMEGTACLALRVRTASTTSPET